MSVPPPPIYSNYPRQNQSVEYPIRPPDVYFAEGLNDAWTMVSRNMAEWVGMTLLLGLFYVPVLILTFIFQFAVASSGGFAEQTIAVSIAQNVISAICSVPLYCAFASFYAATVRRLNGEPMNMKWLLAGFRRFGSFVVGMLVYLLVLGVMSAIAIPLVLQARGDTNLLIGLIAVGALLAFGSTFVLYPINMFVPMDLVLSDRSLFESIIEAYRRTWTPLLAAKFFALSLMIGMIFIAGYCACFVGLVVAVPFAVAIVGVHYRYFYPPIAKEEAPRATISEMPPA